MVAVRARDLFEAFAENRLPLGRGRALSASFGRLSTYELVSYGALRGVRPRGDGLVFEGEGREFRVIVEPPRSPGEGIPRAAGETETWDAGNGARVLIDKRSRVLSPSFTIRRPPGFGFALIFYDLPDGQETLSFFLEKTFTHEAALPPADAQRAAALVVRACF